MELNNEEIAAAAKARAKRDKIPFGVAYREELDEREEAAIGELMKAAEITRPQAEHFWRRLGRLESISDVGPLAAQAKHLTATRVPTVSFEDALEIVFEKA